MLKIVLIGIGCLFVGMFIGILVSALASAAKDADDREEAYFKEKYPDV